MSVSAAAASSVPASSKRKPTGSNATEAEEHIDVTGISPYEAKNKIANHHADKASKGGEDHVVCRLSDNVLNLVPGKLGELGVGCINDLSEEDYKVAVESLSKDDVDEYLHLLVLPKSVLDKMNEFAKQIQYADRRYNNPSDEEDGGPVLLMFNTYSSYLMVEAIQRQLTEATRVLNKALKAAKSINSSGPGIAKDALGVALAASIAADNVSHWRHDTETPEDCKKIGKKIEKLFRDLLWFSDEELGIVDPFTRKAIISKLEEINRDWKRDSSGYGPSFTINVKTAKNGLGLGRFVGVEMGSSATPTSKRAKTVPTGSASAPGLCKYLSDFDDILSHRVKTILQLKITDESNPKKSVLVVLSGATCMKKMNQICAFLTGKSSDFQYNSQKGRCMKDSRIELCFGGETLWFAEKAAAKKAGAVGASHLEDKTVKIVQIFQCLNVSTNGGMFFDSGMACDLAASPGSLAWVAPDGQGRYNITVQCVVAKKALLGRELPLPRMVSFDLMTDKDKFNYRAKTSFGMNYYQTSQRLLGDRQPPKLLLLGAPTKAQLKSKYAFMFSHPLCNEDSTSVDCVGEENSYYYRTMTKKNVETAYLPPNGGVTANGKNFSFNGGQDCSATITS